MNTQKFKTNFKKCFFFVNEDGLINFFRKPKLDLFMVGSIPQIQLLVQHQQAAEFTMCTSLAHFRNSNKNMCFSCSIFCQ